MDAQQIAQQYFDAHTHLLDYPNQSLSQIMQNSLKNNVNKIMVNTTSSQQFEQLLQVYKKYNNIVYCGFGVHPLYIAKQKIIDGLNEGKGLEQMQDIIKQNQMYTVGQIGLDFRKIFLEQNTKQIQMEYFKKQLQIAFKYDRPVTIHCVRAHGEMLKIFKDINKKWEKHTKPHLIMHSYGGSIEITQSFLKLTNLKIFFSLCLKRSVELCQTIPIQNLIVQTDSPCQNNLTLLQQQNWVNINKYLQKFKFQTEEQKNKAQTNQPSNVVANVKSLFKYYKMQERTFSKILFENTLKAFKLIK